MNEEIDESWRRRYFGEKSDKYLILMICVGIIIQCYGVFSLFLSFLSSNTLINITINIAISFIGFLVSFISCMFYLRTRNL